MHRCAGGLWLQGHTARIATLLRWQNISLCAFSYFGFSLKYTDITVMLKLGGKIYTLHEDLDILFMTIPCRYWSL